jgi:hypothetical protein
VITRDSGRAAVVLVVEDVEKIRDGIEEAAHDGRYRRPGQERRRRDRSRVAALSSI